MKHVEHFVCSSISWKQHVEPLSLRTQALMGKLTHQTLPIDNWTFVLGVYIYIYVATFILIGLKGLGVHCVLEWLTNF